MTCEELPPDGDSLCRIACGECERCSRYHRAENETKVAMHEQSVRVAAAHQAGIALIIGVIVGLLLIVLLIVLVILLCRRRYLRKRNLRLLRENPHRPSTMNRASISALAFSSAVAEVSLGAIVEKPTGSRVSRI